MENNDFIVEINYSVLQEIGILLSKSIINLQQEYVDSVKSKLHIAIQNSHAKVQKEKLEAMQNAQEGTEKAE